MKRIITRWTGACVIALGVAGVAVAADPAASGPFEVTAALVAGIPGSGDFDVYDSSLGARVECRYWTDETFGLAAWAGMEQWNAGGGSRNWGREADGDLQAIPLGVSGLMRLAPDAPVSVTLKAGIGYVMADSNLEFKGGFTPERINVDDGWIAEAGLDLNFALSDRWSLYAGSFYRLDLSKGGVSGASGGALEDNQFEGINFTLGLKRAL